MLARCQLRAILIVVVCCYVAAQTCGLRPPPDEGDSAHQQCGTTCGLRPPPAEAGAGDGHAADLNGDGKVSTEEFVEFATKQAEGNDGKQESPTNDSGPLELTADTFDPLTAGSNAAFVKFFAPWCGHCRSMAKAYSDLANTVHSKYPGLKVGSVNCDDQKEFCEMFGIEGFPTLLLMKSPEAFADSAPVLYDGSRDYDSMLKFLQEQEVLV